MHDWKNLHYLKLGTEQQQRAHRILAELDLWATLRDFDPVLAGTVPLALDVATSDLDVICEVPLTEHIVFEQLLRNHYGDLPGFQVRRTRSRGRESLVSNFWYAGMPIELFGQAQPTMQQYAFRHLVVEHAILQIGGEAWRAAVLHLKQQGLKTEPAFASLLGLPGDPYEALLLLEGQSTADLAGRLSQCLLPILAP